MTFRKKHVGSDFDVLLEQDGTLKKVTDAAAKRVNAWRLEKKALKFTESAHAEKLACRPRVLRTGDEPRSKMVELHAELQAFRERLPFMVSQHNGEYVVFKGARAVHFAPTYASALTWAYVEFGLEQFFVKKVSEEEAVAHFSRDPGPCRR